MSLALMLFASFVVQVIYAGNPELPDAALSPEASRLQGNSSNIALSPLDAKSQISPRSKPLDETRAPQGSKRSGAKPAPPSDAKPGSKRSKDKAPGKNGKDRFFGLKFGVTKKGGFNVGLGLPSVGLAVGDQSSGPDGDAAGDAPADGAPAAPPAGDAPAAPPAAGDTPAAPPAAGDAPAGDAPPGDAPAGDPPAKDPPAKDPPASDARRVKSPVKPQSKSGTKG